MVGCPRYMGLCDVIKRVTAGPQRIMIKDFAPVSDIDV